MPAGRTRGGGLGFGQRPFSGDTRIDAVAQFVAFDGVQKTCVNATGSISPAPIPRPKSLAVIHNQSCIAPLLCVFATVATPRRMDNPRRAFILSDMNTDTDIAVIGGGLNGPLLALAMASQGHRVTVIDATAQSVRKNAAFDGRSYAVALTSQRLLAGLGLWRQLADNAQAMLEIKVTDGRAGEGPSPFFMH